MAALEAGTAVQLGGGSACGLTGRSSDALGLLSGFLEVRPDMRFSVTQALSHSWFQGHGDCTKPQDAARVRAQTPKGRARRQNDWIGSCALTSEEDGRPGWLRQVQSAASQERSVSF